MHTHAHKVCVVGYDRLKTNVCGHGRRTSAVVLGHLVVHRLLEDGLAAAAC